MTDKQEQTPNEEQNIDNDDVPSTTPDDLDIDGALASIASLQTLAEDEPETSDDDVDDGQSDVETDEPESLLTAEEADIQEFERIDDVTSEDDSDILDDDIVLESEHKPEQESSSAVVYATSFPKPPASVLHRGQLASIVPALLLIGIGGYLTFALTTNALTLSPAILIAILVGSIGLALLAQWVSSARWSIGSFFIGAMLLLVGATVAYLLLPTNLTFADGYPLIITAIGTAFVLTDIVVPSGRKVWLFGLILAIAGLVGIGTTTIIVNTDLANVLSSLLPLAIAIVVILLIIPVFRRSQ